MRVYLFMDRFAGKVRNGSKRQTIRTGEPRCKTGDVLSLRRWTGKPYRSKQEVLRDGMCTGTVPVEVAFWGVNGWIVYVDGKHVDGVKLQALARADGFENAADMKKWIENVHGPMNFHGHMVKWA